jgi:hypothetical protein
VLAFLCIAIGPASAQSIYVAGAVGADITFVSGQESAGFSVPTGGEAMSGAARLGVALTDRFGVELEVSRAGEIRNTSQPGFPVPLAGLAPFILSEIEFRSQLTTISTSASIQQQLSDSVALALLGGVVFHRTDSEMIFRRFASGGIFSIPPIPLPTGVNVVTSTVLTSASSSILAPSAVESVQYGTGPLVGVEVKIGVGDHLDVIPGVRMHGLPASWLVRPAVAVGWTF